MLDEMPETELEKVTKEIDNFSYEDLKKLKEEVQKDEDGVLTQDEISTIMSEFPSEEKTPNMF